MVKSLFLLFFLIFIVFFNVENLKDIFLDSSNSKIKFERKKYLTECELENEIINREILDNERQCYYSCDIDDIVRVDTSIEYMCQPYILEER